MAGMSLSAIPHLQYINILRRLIYVEPRLPILSTPTFGGNFGQFWLWDLASLSFKNKAEPWCRHHNALFVNELSSFTICPLYIFRTVLKPSRYTVKKVSRIPVFNRGVTYQTLRGQELLNYSRLWESLVSDIPAGDGKTTNLFCSLAVPSNL